MIIMNGRDLKKEKLEKLKEKITQLNKKLGLAVIQVGNDEASNVYVNQKAKMAAELGYNFIHETCDENISQDELLNIIDKLNADDSIDGILVQMPLPKQLDSNVIQNAISPLKDVDGLTYINSGKLVQNQDGLVPCTPKGIIDMLDHYEINLDGANVVVIGRSSLVGKPVASLLTNRNATVVLCHSKTDDIKKYTLLADIIIVAVGKKNFLTEDMVREGSVVIDVGINRENGKLYGDVDYENVKDKCSYITPVPGGVGQMTVAELGENVYKAHTLRKKLERK